MTVPDVVKELLTGHDTPEPARVRVLSRSVSALDEIERLLDDDRAEGWVCYPDGVYDVRGHSRAPEREERQRPLSAELFVDGESIVVRLGEDGWRLARIREETEDDAVDTLYFDQNYLSTEPGRSLRYRIYWRRSDDELGRPWRPWVAAFRGWTEEGGQ